MPWSATKFLVLGLKKGLWQRGQSVSFLYEGTAVNTRGLGVLPKANASFLTGFENNARAVGYVYTLVDLGCLKVNCLTQDPCTMSTAKIEFSPPRYPKEKNTLEEKALNVKSPTYWPF